MRTALLNGKIYQGKGQFIQALLIEDEIIIKSGTNNEIAKEKSDCIIDLKGKCVIPGFNDCHMHLSYYAKNKLRVTLDECKSVEEALQLCRDYIAAHPDCKGVYGRGYNEDHFTDCKMFTKKQLNDISTTIPITLTRICGHSCICNDAALDLLGKKSDDGFLYEDDCDKTKFLYSYDDNQLKQVIITSIHEAESVGITSIQSQDIDDFNQNGDFLRILEEIYKKDDDLLRWHLQAQFSSFEQFRNTVIEHKYKLNTSSKKLTLGPLKLFKDGSLGAKTALLKDGYIDNRNNKGIEVNSDEQMDEFVSFAEENGIQVFTHAIGDSAIEKVTNSYRKAMKKGNPNRHTINHCQITTTKMLEEMAKHHIPVAYQPIFLEYDLHMVEKRIDKELAKQSYAYKTADSLGIVCGFSTDCPVEPFNPFLNLHCAINRQDLDDYPEGGYNLSEKVNVEKAIDFYSYGSSFIQFEENRKGLLKEGYLADLLVLDTDIFTCDPKEIKNINVEKTIIGGKIVYERKLPH